MIHNRLKFTSLLFPCSWGGRILDWHLSQLGFDLSYGKLVCLATLLSSDRTKQISPWITIYIYAYTYKYTLSIYIYIYIYIYICQTDCFVASQLFSVAWHVGRLKLGSTPAQLYVRLSITPLSQQANHVSSGIKRNSVVAFVNAL